MSLLNDRRTLLDIATGGRYKTSKDIPQMSTTGKVTPENLSWLYERFFSDKEHNVKGGPGFALEAVSPAGIIKKANTARSLFQGWRDNLYKYASTLSKKQQNKIEGIINKVWRDVGYDVDIDDIKTVQSKLAKINKDTGFSKNVKVPDIEGVAGGVARRSKMQRGDVVKKQQKVINRQSTDVAAERRKKFHQKNIDKGLQRGSRRSGIY